MVHLVRKFMGSGPAKKEYLYLQKSFHIQGTNKKRTEHVAYLGKVDKYLPEQLQKILHIANKKPKQLRPLLEKYNQQYKRMLKRKAKDLKNKNKD